MIARTETKDCFCGSPARAGFDYCGSYCAAEAEAAQAPKPYEVCPRCEGEGQHTNPAIDGNGLTSSDIDELGPDFMEDYLSGVYDVRCEECNGERVIRPSAAGELRRIERAEDLRTYRMESGDWS